MAAGKKIAPKRRMKPYLEQTGGTGRGRTFELSRSIVRIGRAEDNEIVMKGDSISRCHAYVDKSPSGDWIIHDNNSKNGIKLNGKVVSNCVLREGDLLVVGDFAFRFHEGTIPPEDSIEKTNPVVVYPLPIIPRAFETKLRHFIDVLEQHSWLAGLIAGLLIGGGLWWRASHSQVRVQSAQKEFNKPTEQIPPAPPSVWTAEQQPQPQPPPAVFPSPPEKMPVAKKDLAVAPPTSKKPKNDIRDLKVYLREGKDYLKEGDKESAAIAFRFALVLNPKNKEALNGLRSAGAKMEPSTKPRATTSVDERRPRLDSKKRLKVADLLKAAVDAFGRRSYQEAIDKAEEVRRIELTGSTEYLNEAKQIIDRARLKQKEDYEPFLLSAREKMEKGDFKGSAALCEEMLRTDPAYAPARECLSHSLDGIAGRRTK